MSECVRESERATFGLSPKNSEDPKDWKDTFMSGNGGVKMIHYNLKTSAFLSKNTEHLYTPPPSLKFDFVTFLINDKF